MADKTRRETDEEEFEVPDDERESGIAETEEEFEDAEEDDEDEDEEDDLSREMGRARFTSEIGSEGGSQGDMEESRRTPRLMRGSEATTTAHVARRRHFDERHAGGGTQSRRQG